MKKSARRLLVKAIKGDSDAYRKLGLCFLEGKGCKRDKKLARLFLEKAMEQGNPKAYFTFHAIFSKGKKIIDDQSYNAICQEYMKSTKNIGKKYKKYLEKLVRLGTRSQKERYGNNNWF